MAMNKSGGAAVPPASGARSLAAELGDAGAPRVISSASLLAGKPQLAILHNRTLYFLRQTRFGKLILTK